DGANKGEIVSGVRKIGSERTRSEAAVIIGISVVETSAQIDEGAQAEPVVKTSDPFHGRAYNRNETETIFATKSDIAARISRIQALLVGESGAQGTTQGVVLVDSAHVGTDDEIVVAIEIRLFVNRVGVPEFQLRLAAPIIHVPVGLGGKSRAGECLATGRIEHCAEVRPAAAFFVIVGFDVRPEAFDAGGYSVVAPEA